MGRKILIINFKLVTMWILDLENKNRINQWNLLFNES